MRLALIAHHVAPIAPPFVGGVESMTWYLSRWLADEGHDVVVFGPPGTEIPGVSVCPLELGPRLSVAARGDVAMPPADFMSAHHAYQQLMVGLGDSRDDFDLVHVNSLHYLPVAMAGLLPYPVILTLHTPPTPWLESALASQRDPALTLTAVSSRTVELWAGIARVDEVVPNGVDLRAWPAGPGGEDAVWTGRMVSEKAPHRAIDAAREAGIALHLAGPIVDAAYWEREIAPRLGSDVHYAGPPRPHSARPAGRPQRRGPGHSRVGGAVRAVSGRSHRNRNPGCGVRPRRPAGGDRAGGMSR